MVEWAQKDLAPTPNDTKNKLKEMLDGISYTLKCEPADSGLLTSWLESKSLVVLLDIDIQGDEYDVPRTSYESVSAKVNRLIIGTHSLEIHTGVLTLFSSWIIIYDVPALLVFLVFPSICATRWIGTRCLRMNATPVPYLDRLAAGMARLCLTTRQSSEQKNVFCSQTKLRDLTTYVLT